MDIKYILDLREFPQLSYADKFTKDFNVILNDNEVTAVAECMGGLEPAFTFVKACLEKGKSVSTSNKELVAEKAIYCLQSLRKKIAISSLRQALAVQFLLSDHFISALQLTKLQRLQVS